MVEEACDEKYLKLWKIHGNWYDLSEFRSRHPGGKFVLDLFQGLDCTDAFEQYHLMNDSHYKILNSLKPKYANDEKKVLPGAYSSYHNELKKMIRDHFQVDNKSIDTTDKHKMPYRWYIYLILLLIINIYGFIGWLHLKKFQGLFLFPLASWLLMVNYAHDGSHFATSKKYVQLNQIIIIFTSNLFFNYGSWFMQHVISHHYHTNDPLRDIDLQHHPFCVWHKDSVVEYIPKSKFILFFWHFTGFILSTFNMSIVHPIKFIFIPLLFWKHNDQTNKKLKDHHEIAFYNLAMHYFRLKFFSPQVHFFHFLPTFVSLSFSLFILTFPLIFHRSILFSFGPYFFSSIIFMIVTQISHVQAIAQEKEENKAQTKSISTEQEQNYNQSDFFYIQSKTSINYAISSFFSSFCTGGLNLQSFHHVFPSIHSAHYTYIFPKFFSVYYHHHHQHISKPLPPDIVSCGAGIIPPFLSHLSFVAQLGEERRRERMSTSK
mmetsp:Transcript_2188/g.3406  ORF Transcript_2188/g.3406 Transcript_2188/m.3406 type:complete len:488 (-) Transcript_2188:184-1647(-)